MSKPKTKKVQPDSKFEASQFDVDWDPKEETFLVTVKKNGVIYNVTPHALAALQDDEYREACWAVQHYVRQGLH